MTTGPSSSSAPYILPAAANIQLTSVITSGDSMPGDGVFAGKADGIGAYDNGDGTITVLINHELAVTDGLIRDHGSAGSFVDRIVLDKATLQIVSADDLIQSVQLWNGATHAYAGGTTAFNKLCSGDLPLASAFFNSATGLGTDAKIYLCGEESGATGRAFGTIATGPDAGTAWQLPYLGRLSHENVVANPFAQDKTIVAETEDSAGGQVYFYVGQKQSTGTDIEKAGLTGGAFYGLKVSGVASEVNGVAVAGSFTLDEIGTNGDVNKLSGAQIETESKQEGVTGFLRPEDCAWDPDHPNDLYFVTTNTFSGNSRLYKATFTDITNPLAGGTIEAVLNGTEGQHMFDNISVANGKVVLEEDPGTNSYVAKIWEYDIASDTLTPIASFDPAVVTSTGSQFITTVEESSGVIDVTGLLGDGDTRAYLLDAQLHASTGDPATVQYGQLLAMFVDPPTDAALNLVGTSAADLFVGGTNDDQINGKNGNNQLFGGDGNDTLTGGSGTDLLSGQNGSDVLTGGTGNDKLFGGADADDFIFNNKAASGTDKILDFNGDDRLLTTAALSDPDGDGLIPVGNALALFGTSTVVMKDGAVPITELQYEGVMQIAGVTYYSYGAPSPVTPAAITQSTQSAVENHPSSPGHWAELRDLLSVDVHAHFAAFHESPFHESIL